MPLMIDAVLRGRLDLEDPVRLMAENTARHFDLWPKKGCLPPAQMVTWWTWKVSVSCPGRRCSPGLLRAPCCTNGWTLVGGVSMTVVRGEQVFRERRVTGREGFSQQVLPRTGRLAVQGRRLRFPCRLPPAGPDPVW